MFIGDDSAIWQDHKSISKHQSAFQHLPRDAGLQLQQKVLPSAETHPSWAADHENWSAENFTAMIYCDEPKFNIFGSDGVQYWQRASPGCARSRSLLICEF
jgi:hypothetical protein